MLDITVIGAGYVGLVTAACFAELGNFVTCIDVDKEKISQLQNANLPLYEPGLSFLVASNIQASRLHFSTTLNSLTYRPQIIFIAVGTPEDCQGYADVQYVLSAAHDIGRFLKSYCVVVDKSTVPVGVSEEVKTIIAKLVKDRGLDIPFDMVSNPEFLREGAAIEDFMHPDRIIIGCNSKKAKAIMLKLYKPLVRNPEKIYFMNIKDAEMTKYAANAMLATKVSFMNEMAVLCERMGVDVENVRVGIGSDSRIGHDFIYPGCGYGGSCFPKDVKALIKMAEKHDVNPLILKAVESRNYHQKRVLAQKIVEIFGNDLSEIVVGVWGLSFKPETDDMREASSMVLLEQLAALNATIQAYDPVAIPKAKKLLPCEWLQSGRLFFTECQYEAAKHANVLVLVTEWKPFCYPDWTMLKKIMRKPIILDGRNQYDHKQLEEAGFDYYGIGRGNLTMNHTHRLSD